MKFSIKDIEYLKVLGDTGWKSPQVRVTTPSGENDNPPQGRVRVWKKTISCEFSLWLFILCEKVVRFLFSLAFP